MEQTLFRYNPWWEKKVFSSADIYRRESLLLTVQKQLNNRQIVFLTGLRRIGKTTLLKLIVQHLISEKGILPEKILYVSLDDYLLSKYSIIEIVEKFRVIHRHKFKEHLYLLLDEITYKDNFEIQLKNLFDSHNVKIIASSSSASLLKNKKSYLTGRNTLIEVLPLNFHEYLQFKNIQISKADNHLQKKYFEDFLSSGGIPEFVLKGDLTYIQYLVDDIIYKDIAAVHNIKNVQILKDFFLLLMERSGKQASINKMANILKISPDTSKRYLEFFSDTYLVYLVNRYGKTNESILSSKKIYASDIGIRSLFTGFRDKGSLFENYVYLKIRYLNPKYIYENTIEMDFFTDDKRLVEVKYHEEDLSEKQQLLFDKIKAKKKYIIRDNISLERFLNE